MTARTTDTLAGARGTVATVDWPLEDARRAVVIAHGYGEHIGRYEHVAQDLAAHGAAVYGLDHHGHGESEGERALVEDFDVYLDDLEQVVRRARAEHPDVPLVLLGHSLGGLIATRYAQARGGLDALVISAPVIGGNPEIEALLGVGPDPRGADPTGGAVTRPRGRSRLRRGPARLPRPVQAGDAAWRCSARCAT